MMKTLIVLALTISISQLIHSQNDFYPLSEGEVFLYKYATAFSTQNDQSSKVEFLEKTVESNGHNYFVSQTSLGSNEDYELIQTIYLRNGANGSILGKFQLEDKEETLLFPEKPWGLNKTWTTSTMGRTTVSTIINLEGSIETPAGTYKNCLLIEFDFGESKTRSYYQKNIGMVAVSMITEGQERLVQYLVKN